MARARTVRFLPPVAGPASVLTRFPSRRRVVEQPRVPASRDQLKAKKDQIALIGSAVGSRRHPDRSTTDHGAPERPSLRAILKVVSQDDVSVGQREKR